MNKFAITIQTMTLIVLAAVLALLWNAAGNLKAIGYLVEQQTVNTNRAPGKTIPLTLLPDVAAEIANIEEILKSESKWPKNAAETQQINERFANAVDKLPPAAQEELLPRLEPRWWDIEALRILKTDPSGDIGSRSTYAGATESLLSRKPVGSSDELAKRLATRKRETDDSIRKDERTAALEAARRAIDSKKDIETAARLLSVYDDDEAKKLTVQLTEISLTQSFTHDLDSIRSETEKYEKLSDAPLKEYAIVRANQAIMELRLRVFSSGITNADIKQKLDGLEKTMADRATKVGAARQARDAEQLKRYQVWALSQIKLVRPYKEVEDFEVSKIPSMIDRNNPLSRAKKDAKQNVAKIVRDDLIRYMSPINPGLLDEAVAQWFRKVYQQQFSELDEASRLDVVTAFATANKKWLE